jgi:hypothetical protein
LAIKNSESDCFPILSDNVRIIAYQNATIEVVFFMLIIIRFFFWRAGVLWSLCGYTIFLLHFFPWISFPLAIGYSIFLIFGDIRILRLLTIVSVTGRKKAEHLRRANMNSRR